MSVNSSGANPLPNEIQNTQTQSSNFDASHIICGANGIPDNIEVKGNMTFAPPYTFNLNRIRADDLLCGVMCNDGGDLQLGSDNLIRLDAQNISITGAQIDLIGAVGDMTMLENAIVSSQLSNATQIQWYDQSLVIQTPLLIINSGIPSSQYFIVYGQSKGENETSQQYALTYPNPEIGQSDITMNLYGYPDINQWFQNNIYNKPDNQYIQATGNTFRFICPDTTMVEIEITWQLRYSFDGTPPDTYFACGLYNQSDDVIVPQSLNWMCSSTSKFKWQTFKTSFTMQTTNQDYFPFYQNQNHNQWSDSDAGGNQRSSIKFKFYQFISYPFTALKQAAQPKINEDIDEINTVNEETISEITQMQNLTQSLCESMCHLDPTQLDDVNVTLDALSKSIQKLELTQSKTVKVADIPIKLTKQQKIDKMIADAKEELRLAQEKISKYDTMSVGSALSFEQISDQSA